jgi:hypothetical protein
MVGLTLAGLRAGEPAQTSPSLACWYAEHLHGRLLLKTGHSLWR